MLEAGLGHCWQGAGMSAMPAMWVNMRLESEAGIWDPKDDLLSGDTTQGKSGSQSHSSQNMTLFSADLDRGSIKSSLRDGSTPCRLTPCSYPHWRPTFGPSWTEFVYPGCCHLDYGGTSKIEDVFTKHGVLLHFLPLDVHLKSFGGQVDGTNWVLKLIGTCLGLGLGGLGTGLDNAKLRFSQEAKVMKEWGRDGQVLSEKVVTVLFILFPDSLTVLTWPTWLITEDWDWEFFLVEQ